jgi:ribosomal protein S27AE
MDISELEPQDAAPRPTGCPHCGDFNAVQRVPMAAEAGRSHVPTAAPPVPLGRRPLMAVLCAAVAALAGDGVLASWHGPSPVPVLNLYVVLGGAGVLAVVNTLGVIGVFKRRKRIRRGLPAALAVWNEGWYCARCGLTYFQPGYEPRGIALHQTFSPAQFQREVYRAGGYEDLVKTAPRFLSAPQAPAVRLPRQPPPAPRARRR